MTYVTILKDGSTVRFEDIIKFIDSGIPDQYLVLVRDDKEWIYLIVENLVAVYPEKS